jgi:hypothetical protein
MSKGNSRSVMWNENMPHPKWGLKVVTFAVLGIPLVQVWVSLVKH